MAKNEALLSITLESVITEDFATDEKQAGKDDEAAPQLAAPSSWDEWRDYRVSGGDLGVWVTASENGEIWEGIPA